MLRSKGSGFSLQLIFGLGQQFLDFEDFFQAGDHRYQKPNPPQCSCSQDRTKLRLEDLFDIERDSNRAPTEKRIRLDLRAAHIGWILVGADVQGPNRHRFASHAFDHTLIKEYCSSSLGKSRWAKNGISVR